MTSQENFTCNDCLFFKQCQKDSQELRITEAALRTTSGRIATLGTLDHRSDEKRQLERELSELQEYGHMLASKIVPTEGCPGPTFIASPETTENEVAGVLICSTKLDEQTRYYCYTPPDQG
jgi:hypothetical protein